MHLGEKNARQKSKGEKAPIPTSSSPRFHRQHPTSAEPELATRIEEFVTLPTVRKLIEQFASQDVEIVTIALRHAQMSSTFLDRLRGRYRQLLPLLQVEAQRALQFLAIQALTASRQEVSTQQTAASTVQHGSQPTLEILREQLADYFANADAPGETFSRNVWDLIHGPVDSERFAVFSLRMNSVLRRLLTSFVEALECLRLDPTNLE